MAKQNPTNGPIQQTKPGPIMKPKTVKFPLYKTASTRTGGKQGRG